MDLKKEAWALPTWLAPTQAFGSEDAYLGNPGPRGLADCPPLPAATCSPSMARDSLNIVSQVSDHLPPGRSCHQGGEQALL